MLPQGEKSRRAVRWISDSINDSDAAKVKTLLNKAIFQFDLNPREAEELLHFYKQALEHSTVLR